jgi:hypothetical protein
MEKAESPNCPTEFGGILTCGIYGIRGKSNMAL